MKVQNTNNHFVSAGQSQKYKKNTKTLVQIIILYLQAAQQGHSQIVNLLLEANASPNTTSNVSIIECSFHEL